MCNVLTVCVRNMLRHAYKSLADSLALTFQVWGQYSWTLAVSCVDEYVVVLCHIRLRLGRTIAYDKCVSIMRCTASLLV